MKNNKQEQPYIFETNIKERQPNELQGKVDNGNQIKNKSNFERKILQPK